MADGMDLRGFVRDLMLIYFEHDYYDISGEDIHDLAIKHGFANAVIATEADCEWAQKYGVEPGDPYFRYSEAFLALLEEDGE
jgi:hypothetical protein